MSLRAFSFPLPETRFFKAGRLVYKFRIRAGSRYRQNQDPFVFILYGLYINQELQEIIRVALANLARLGPFSSTRFNVFPHKKAWQKASTVTFEHGGEKLSAYPYVITLHLEANFKVPLCRPPCPEPQSKRSKSDSPLEDSILQELLDAEASIPCHVIGCYVIG
ncbi:unnamed protein product [Merluccius merluccius]